MREKIDLFLPCDDLQEARFTTIDLHEDKQYSISTSW